MYIQVRKQQLELAWNNRVVPNKKRVHQGCILSPCLFNFYAEYIMRNAGLEEAQAGIKFARRNIKNLSYADDTTLMAESEEELKSLLMKVKEESENVGLKLNIGALGPPRTMVRGRWRERASGWGTRLYLWRIHVEVWQNQYNIVK